jgi:hypothetical protein
MHTICKVFQFACYENLARKFNVSNGHDSSILSDISTTEVMWCTGNITNPNYAHEEIKNRLIRVCLLLLTSETFAFLSPNLKHKR